MPNPKDLAPVFNIGRYMTEYADVLSRLDVTTVERMAHVLFRTWKAARTVFCCGNGGSAASACHFMADLTKLTVPPRGPRLRAMALTESFSAISAIANDISYNDVFVEQLKPFLGRHDVVIGLSTSDSSPNVLRAIEFANSVGAITLAVTGRNGLPLQALAHHTLMVQSTSVQHVEDATMVGAHLLCLRTKDLIARAGDSQEVVFKEEAAELPGLRAVDAVA